MKKFFAVIALILSIIFISPERIIANDMANVIKKALSDSIANGGQARTTWEEGIRQEFGGQLKDLTVDIEVLQEESDGKYAIITINAVFTGFFINRGGEKDRVVITRVISFLCDKSKLVILDVAILFETREYKAGWDGRDV